MRAGFALLWLTLSGLLLLVPGLSAAQPDAGTSGPDGGPTSAPASVPAAAPASGPEGAPPAIAAVLTAKPIEFESVADADPGEVEVAKAECRGLKGSWKTTERFQACMVRGQATGWAFFTKPADGAKPAYLAGKAMMSKGKLDGPVVEYHPNGRVRFTGQHVLGKREGVFRARHAGGQPANEVRYVDDKLDGPSIFWFANCRLQARGEFVRGEKQGPWETFYSNGAPEQAGSYDNGRRTGVWRFHQKTGVKYREGPFVDDVEDGVWEEWSVTGKPWRKVAYERGTRVGPAVTACAEAGGEWKVDYELIEEGCLVDDKTRVGAWRGDHPGGSPRWVGTYVDGLLDGEYRAFHTFTRTGLIPPYRGEPVPKSVPEPAAVAPGGSGPDEGAQPPIKPARPTAAERNTPPLLHIGRYVKGIPEGTHRFTAADGKLFGEATVLNGEGDWMSWNEKGEPLEQGYYLKGQQGGLWRYWFTNGNVKEEITWFQGKRDGPIRMYFETGELKAQGQFYGGRAQGVWQAFFRNGRVAWQGSYESGARVGAWKFSTWEALPDAEGEFAADEKEGPWREFHSNGKVKGEGPYHQGSKNGVWREFWPSGEVWRTVQYIDDVEDDVDRVACDQRAGAWKIDPDGRSAGCNLCRPTTDGKGEPLAAGRWRWWHPNGQVEREGTFDLGEREGLFTSWYESGQVQLRGRYHKGQAAGPWEGWHRDGRQRFQGGYLDGKEDGEWLSFHRDGSVAARGDYAAGRRVGKWTWFHPNGKVREVGNHDAEGRPTGAWQSWHADGSKRSEGSYRDGEKDGAWQWWHPDGSEWRTDEYTARGPDAGTAATDGGAGDGGSGPPDGGPSDEPPAGGALPTDPLLLDGGVLVEPAPNAQGAPQVDLPR